MATPSTAAAPASGGLMAFLAKLQSIKIGGSSTGGVKVPRKQLTGIMSTLGTLVNNGLSLPKALGTLARERSLKAYAGMLEDVKRRIEAGETFSTALSHYSATFPELMVHQIRVGERSGTIPETLIRIAEQLEKGNKIRSAVIKRLSYPAIVMVAGSGVVTFMLLFIIPVFDETYKKAKIPLPFITRCMIGLADVACAYGWIVPVAAVLGALAWRHARKNPLTAAAMDAALLRMPLFGEFFRNLAVLQFVEVLGVMMESGFKVVDALAVAADSIGNRAVRKAVNELKTAVVRGEKLSREIERHGDMFPPIVCQLVIVGEQTGKLATTTKHVREHLEKSIERTTEILVGTIEPVLTMGLAFAIGTILMSIYLPMFDMINVVAAE